MPADVSKKPRASSAPPRKINVQKFAEARAAELEALHLIVENRLSNDLRSRRNKRRRTTAYDSQIAKRRCRKRRKLETVANKSNDNASASEKDQKKLPRRVRRAMELKKNCVSGFSTSGDGTKRLRTHVWHAKRFTMTKLWGFHIPLGLQGRGRGSRALLKWFNTGAVVHDASYNFAVQLEGPEDSLMSVLRVLLVRRPPLQSEDVNNLILSGSLYGTAMLHHVGAPDSRPIAPVTYMWQPCTRHITENGISNHSADGCDELQSSRSSRHLWVWIHASAFDEGYGAIKLACQKQMDDTGTLINCSSLEGQLAKLEVMGSKAFELLQKTLHPATCNFENSWQSDKSSVSEADYDIQDKKSKEAENENVSPHSILSLTVIDPRAFPEKNIADISVSACTGDLNNEPDDRSRESAGILDKDASLLPKSKEDSCFSDCKSLWDASSRVSCPVSDNVVCLEKHHARMKFVCLDDPRTKMLENSILGQGARYCPLLLLKGYNQTGSLKRWSLILPISWVRVFWIYLIAKGAHAIGLRERRWIACEVGLPHFPSDFPDCEAYSSSMAAEEATLEQKSAQLPPAVRPFKVPISLPWNSITVAADKGSTSLQDNQTSINREIVDGNSISNAKSQSRENSFDGVIARTSSAVMDFLHEINGDEFLLFPLVPSGKMEIFELMKSESKFSHGENILDQFTSNHKSCFYRVLLHAYMEGVFEEGAVICAPKFLDVSLYTSRSENIEDGLQIPPSAVRSFFREQCSGKWEVQVPGDSAARESYRRPIGFVTTGFVRGSKKPVAGAFCEAVSLARLREEQWNEMPVKRRKKEIYVLVRNLRSSAYRLALATVVLEQQEDDLEFL